MLLASSIAVLGACADGPGQSGDGAAAADGTTTTTDLVTTTEPVTTTVARPTRGGPPPEPTEPPDDITLGLAEDPIALLPSTSADDRLVVSMLGDDAAPLLLIDLASGRLTPVESEAEHVDASFIAGALAFTLDRRTVGLLDPDDPGEVTRVPLPADVPGVISTMVADESGIVVVVGVPVDLDDPDGRREPGPYVFYGPDGELRCVAEVPPSAAWDGALFDGSLWLDSYTTRVDRDDCSSGPGLVEPAGYQHLRPLGDSVVVAGTTVLSVHDAATGTRLGTSEPLGTQIWSVAVTADAVWVVVDGDLVKLDPDTLQELHRSGPIDCGGMPVVFEAGDAVWVVDDCLGILAEVDPVSGDYVESWYLPHTGEDHFMTFAVVGDGIWFVDTEQTGEPYRFDFVSRRFERMSIPREDAEAIYALAWDVTSVRPDPAAR